MSNPFDKIIFFTFSDICCLYNLDIFVFINLFVSVLIVITSNLFLQSAISSLLSIILFFWYKFQISLDFYILLLIKIFVSGRWHLPRPGESIKAPPFNLNVLYL